MSLLPACLSAVLLLAGCALCEPAPRVDLVQDDVALRVELDRLGAVRRVVRVTVCY